MRHYVKRLAILVCIALLFISCGSMRIAVEEEQTALSVFVGNSWNVRRVLSVIQERFPELELDITYYTGPNTTEYLNLLIENGDVPDLIFATNRWTDDRQEEVLLNLSGYSFVNNYMVSFLNDCEVDGQIYLLPGYYHLDGVFYNKTLFEEMGWAAPENREEMIALVSQIREESDLIPLAFTGVYTGTYFRIMTTYAQAGFLSTPAGKEWEEAFVEGYVSTETGFGEGLSMIKELCEANAFDSSSEFNADRTTYEQLINREVAMIIPASGQSTFAEMMEETTDTFGMLPFFGENEGEEIVTLSAPLHFGLAKQLGEPGNEEKLSDALDILEFFSTREGKEELRNSIADVSPLAGTEMEELFEPYQDCWKYMESGQVSDFLYSGYEDVMIAGGEAIKEMMFGDKTVQDVITAMDETRHDSLMHPENTVVTTIGRDYSEAETLELMAHFLLAEGQGDLALVSAGGYDNGTYNRNGVSGRLFKGDLSYTNYNCVVPGNLTATIVNLTMTGAQLKNLLENGCVIVDEDGNTGTFAYCLAGEEQSMLEDEREYRVSMASNDFDVEVFTETEDTGMLVTEAYLRYLEQGLLEK